MRDKTEKGGQSQPPRLINLWAKIIGMCQPASKSGVSNVAGKGLVGILQKIIS